MTVLVRGTSRALGICDGILKSLAMFAGQGTESLVLRNKWTQSHLPAKVIHRCHRVLSLYLSFLVRQ